MSREQSGQRPGRWTGTALFLLILALPFFFPGQPAAAAPEAKDTCADCHGDPEFLVTNKKLYDYFKDWSGSVHQQEGVTCDDCHGGDPNSPDKKVSHAKGVSEDDPDSGIYYANVPETCGECHDDILKGYVESHHFEHLEAEEENDQQGPSCVTCHGSIDVGVLDVNSVEAACARCHNQENDNHPENPEKAREVLSRLHSIHRFYRYVTIRTEPKEASQFFRDIDERLRKLAITWHTFDLEKIEAETTDILDRMKAKRDEVRRRKAKQP
jgi:formate-dependent nitrite reductase cytochrome c552 subunit